MESVVTRSASIKAIRFEQFGDPSLLTVHEVDTPARTPGDVLIKILAAGVNPSDAKNVTGAMAQTTLPRIPGRDFAGVVVDGAPDLNGVEVWGSGGDIGFTRDGAHAEYLAIPAAAVQPKPSTLTMAQAAACGVAFTTAWLALVDTAALAEGETVVITGASGAVGSSAVQIAKWRGARVIAVIRDDRHAEALKEAGADTIVNIDSQTLAPAIMDSTGGRGADVVFDTVSGRLFEPSLVSLAVRGRFVAISAMGDGRVSFNLRDFYHRQARLFGADSLALDTTGAGYILARLASGFDCGALKPPRAIETVPLDQAGEAYARVLRGADGKLVLIP